jgi:gluconokinase
MKTKFYVLMGVSGSGKTTVGKLLAERLGWTFYDADDFHSPASIAKMTAGSPLNDEDRAPWLESLHELISSSIKHNSPGVLACSALKDKYRQLLVSGIENIHIVYLKGDYAVIQQHMQARQGHYMKSEMIKSQFDVLEEPENVSVMDVRRSPDEIVDKILEKTGD